MNVCLFNNWVAVIFIFLFLYYKELLLMLHFDEEQITFLLRFKKKTNERFNYLYYF